MPPAVIFRKIAFLAIVPFLMLCACSPTREQIVEIKFAEPPASESDLSRTLESLVTVKGIGGQYATGGIYLITHYGDREELFREENQRVIEHPMIEDTWRFCSAAWSATGQIKRALPFYYGLLLFFLFLRFVIFIHCDDDFSPGMLFLKIPESFRSFA